MRLLNAQTGQFVWVDSPEEERYAILSHVWSKDPDAPEQAYHDILRIQEEVRIARVADPTLPVDEVLRRASPKIRNACRYALSDGLPLIWIDAPCIDKTSSAELSEAINSMYEWYRLSTVCYAFLHDVTEDTYTNFLSSFHCSAWHTRGWTLQELIAPAVVVFLSSDWHMLGGKHRFAGFLEYATGIDRDILTHSRPLDTFSVAQRMFWASKRRTTRKEDEAYCLMGIFGIHIPIIYGEGQKAFLRLQEKILKQIPDQSIFVWYRRPTGLVVPAPFTEETQDNDNHALFASSPARFAFSSGIRTISKDVLAQKLRIRKLPPTAYIVTSEGMRVTFPLQSIAPAVDIAVLSCEDRHGRLLGLVLRQTKLAYVRSVGAPLNNRSFLNNSSSIITQHPSEYIYPFPAVDSSALPFTYTSIFRSIFSPRPAPGITGAQPTVAEVYVVHSRTPPTPRRPEFALDPSQGDHIPFKMIFSPLLSPSSLGASYTCVFSKHEPSPVLDTFTRPPSVIDASLPPVADTPAYTLQITGEANSWTSIARFTSSQCTLGGEDILSSLAVKVTFTQEGEVVNDPTDYLQDDFTGPEDHDACIDHVHCWHGDNLLRYKDFNYPSTSVHWSPFFIRLYLYLEYPGSHTYPPTASLWPDVTLPRELPPPPEDSSVGSSEVHYLLDMLGNDEPLVLSEDAMRRRESRRATRHSSLWRSFRNVLQYGRGGIHSLISRMEDYPAGPQALKRASKFGHIKLRDALDKNFSNPAYADHPAFDHEEEQSGAPTPLTIRLSIMDRVPYIGSVNQMMEGQPLSRGTLATAIAREVLQFLERERTYGDPLRYGDLEIQLEDLVLVDVERESSTVLVPMLALSIDDEQDA